MGNEGRFACLTSAVIVAIALVAGLWMDRTSVISRVGQAATTNARLIAAHGDASLGEARQLVAAILPELERLDPADPTDGRALHQAMQNLVRQSSRITSAWVLDGDGNNLVDSWAYPPDPVQSADRAYFRRHLAGEPDPVIAGSERGSVAGIQRFTYSHARRGGNGNVESVLVVGLHTDALATVFEELGASSAALSGLYRPRGDVLAEAEPAREAVLSDVARSLRAGRGDGGIVQASFGGTHVVAWQMSREYPDIVALSAVDLAAALTGWRTRVAAGLAIGALIVALVCFLTHALTRARAEREKVERMEFAAREVSHRMKNSLQMIGSFVGLRARRAGNPATRHELELIASQLHALASVQELLEVSETEGTVDLTSVLERLCRQIEKSHGIEIETAYAGRFMIDSAAAGRIAIMTNELVVNAAKHGDGRVRVETTADAASYRVAVANGGGALPEGFEIGSQSGFGLRAANAVAESIGADLRARNGGAFGGAEFTVTIPVGEARDAA